MAVTRAGPGPLIEAGLLLGIGLGGFVDGILLHQILQWHEMLTSVVPPVDLVSVKINMFWDGIFHAFTWTCTAAGVGLLWRALRTDGAVRSGRLLAGAMLAGWGAFNLVEGVIDHQILGLHHVRPGPAELAWDLGFLGLGAALVGAGVLVARGGTPHRPTATSRDRIPERA